MNLLKSAFELFKKKIVSRSVKWKSIFDILTSKMYLNYCPDNPSPLYPDFHS